jgi:hypothetical protein
MIYNQFNLNDSNISCKLRNVSFSIDLNEVGQLRRKHIELQNYSVVKESDPFDGNSMFILMYQFRCKHVSWNVLFFKHASLL